MSEPDVIAQIAKCHDERMLLLEKLAIPAEAAANAMRDAGMKNSADPLAAVLFELEANSQKIRDLILNNQQEFEQGFIRLVERT